MAKRRRVPAGALRAVIGLGTAAYVACCLLAIPFVDDMRNFPTSSRRVMVSLLLAFAAASVCLCGFMLRGRGRAALTATVVGVAGVLLFGPGALSDGKGDPEWLDAGAAMVSVCIRVAIGCLALAGTGIVAGVLSHRGPAPRPLIRQATNI